LIVPATKSSNNNHEEQKIPLLVLVGPTAVGKTALAVKVAQRLQTEIISADSAQVYRCLDIGTAKPSEEEKKAAPHHLIDIVDPDCNFSVADYQQEANKTIRKLWQEKKLPFIVGGTGLYINAVIEGYAFGHKGANRRIREDYEQLAATKGLENLYEKLQTIDPEAASKIHPNDRKRIIRALEVYDLEGRPISEQVARTSGRKPPYQTVIFGLFMDRESLYERINQRVDSMIESGWLDEIRYLCEKGYGENDPGMQILGYRELLAYFQGKISWEYTIKEIKKQTRNLAKRQLTWFRRNQNIEWLKVTGPEGLELLTENICFKVQDLVPARANN